MQALNTMEDYVIRVFDEPGAIDITEWQALLALQPEPTPFTDARYLWAMHESGSAVEETGWRFAFVTLWREGVLQAACPTWLKSHSYGEYVFDWAWAEAHERHGLPYYPKLLGAVPFTPVPGTRLLARDPAARKALAEALAQVCRQHALSSAHVLFIDEADQAAFEAAGWMIRHGVQFHWQQDGARPITDFTDLLSRLHREKRKKIQQEQRRVREAGVHFTVHRGDAIGEDLWDHFYRCYTITYRLHRSTPYLSRRFFTLMAQRMPDHWLMFVAHDAQGPVGCSLIALDPQRKVAYGRYWGAIRSIPCLHFDACYYQPLAWCLANGWQRFEGGAQGEHKMARGLMPVGTRSAHWLADPRFARAVEDFLQREGAHVGAYVDELREHSPFKAGDPSGVPAGSVTTDP